MLNYKNAKCLQLRSLSNRRVAKMLHCVCGGGTEAERVHFFQKKFTFLVIAFSEVHIRPKQLLIEREQCYFPNEASFFLLKNLISRRLRAWPLTPTG